MVCVSWQEELRMTAAALLNDLAEALGNDLCKQFVTPEMESLSEVRDRARATNIVLALGYFPRGCLLCLKLVVGLVPVIG